MQLLLCNWVCNYLQRRRNFVHSGCRRAESILRLFPVFASLPGLKAGATESGQQKEAG